MSVRARLTAATVAVTTAALVAPVPGGAATPTATGTDTVEVTGLVQVLAGEGGEPDRYSLLLPSGRSIELAEGFTAEPLSRFTGTLAVPGAGSGDTLSGAERSTTLRRASTDRQPMEVVASRTTPSAAVAPGPTTHSTYVAKVTNFGAIGLTDQQILNGVAGANAYWVRESSGVIPAWNTVAGVAAVTSDVGSFAAGCGLGNGGADFAAIAQNVGAKAFPGVDFSGTAPNHLVVVVPDNCGGTTAGRGRLGSSLASGGPVILQALPGPNLRIVLEHEYGHNVSLHHANNAIEYGNLYEVMGAGPDNFPNPALGTVYRWELGITAPGEVVDGSNGGGPWVLAARTASSGSRSVTFIDPDTGLRHFVDSRTGGGADAGTVYAANNGNTYYNQTFSTGLVVERENDEAGSFLRKPDTSNDGALQGNEAWTNAGGTLVVRGNGSSVTISRNLAAPAVTGGTAAISSPTALRDVVATASGFSPVPNGYRYQWTLNGQPIAGAEEREFRPTTAMVGAQLAVTVTAYATGRNPVSRTAPPQTVAPATWFKSQTSRERPELVGSAQVGQTLSVAGMDWVNYNGEKPADFSTTYQWVRDGAVVPGATGSSYTLTGADVGSQVYAREYPRAAGYATTSYSTTAPTPSVLQGRLVTKRPKISGKAKVGKKVVAKVKGWTTGTKFRYQWYLGKKAIKKATKKKLVLTRAMRGKKLTVKVTGRKAGYKKASVKSKPTKVK